MNKYGNIDRALKIREELGTELPEKYGTRTILNAELQKELISKFKRKWNKRKKVWDTYCGQYTSRFFLDAGYDMSFILGGKHYNNINTTGQYSNAVLAVENGLLIEVTAEQAFFLTCVGRPALVLSPRNMVVDGKPYNHAAVTWPIYWKSYDSSKGPAITQQGYHSLCPGWVSSPAAWGKNWEHKMVKYFLPGLR